MGRFDEVESIELLRRKKRALELRLQSKSLRAIGAELGVTAKTADAWIREMTITQLPQEETEAVRAHEAAKIDGDEETANRAIEMLINEGTQRQERGETTIDVLEAIRRWQDTRRELRRQRALMLGLNKPVLVEHTHNINKEFDQEIESLVTDLLGGGKVMSLPEDVIVDE